MDQHVLTTFGNIENDDTVPNRSSFSFKSTWTSRSDEIDLIRQNEDFNADSKSNHNLHSFLLFSIFSSIYHRDLCTLLFMLFNNNINIIIIILISIFSTLFMH
jgi:hypothetical protein